MNGTARFHQCKCDFFLLDNKKTRGLYAAHGKNIKFKTSAAIFVCEKKRNCCCGKSLMRATQCPQGQSERDGSSGPFSSLSNPAASAMKFGYPRLVSDVLTRNSNWGKICALWRGVGCYKACPPFFLLFFRWQIYATTLVRLKWHIVLRRAARGKKNHCIIWLCPSQLCFLCFPHKRL